MNQTDSYRTSNVPMRGMWASRHLATLALVFHSQHNPAARLWIGENGHVARWSMTGGKEALNFQIKSLDRYAVCIPLVMSDVEFRAMGALTRSFTT